MLEAMSVLRASLRGVDLVVGKVTTASDVATLLHAGVDAVKVGIGPWSI